MRTLCFSLLLFLIQPAFALLSPLDQSIVELQNIFESPDLTKHLPTSEKFQSITATQEGYILRTEEYQMLVDVEYQPAKGLGPVQFKLFFHEPKKYQP